MRSKRKNKKYEEEEKKTRRGRKNKKYNFERNLLKRKRIGKKSEKRGIEEERM